MAYRALTSSHSNLEPLHSNHYTPTAPSTMFSTFDHTADLGIRVTAATMPGVFEEAARALFSVLLADSAEIRPSQTDTIRIAGDEPDLLLVDWLSELLYRFEIDRMAFGTFAVMIGDGTLTAEVGGERLDPARHVSDHDIKAITYHDLRLEQVGGERMAEVIVDI